MVKTHQYKITLSPDDLFELRHLADRMERDIALERLESNRIVGFGQTARIGDRERANHRALEVLKKVIEQFK